MANKRSCTSFPSPNTPKLTRRSNLMSASKPVWLIGTMSAPGDFERRTLIRSTWQALYNETNYTFRFVLGKVDDQYAKTIEAEREQYNDLILIPSLEEKPGHARTIKPLEFLAQVTTSGEFYDFVSVVSDDSFINIPDFTKEYIAPRMRRAVPEPCLIGRPLIYRPSSQLGGQKFMYPDAQFFTLSWDLVEVVARQYSLAPPKDAGDEILGRLLDRSQENFAFVRLGNRQVFNYDPRRDDPHAWSHRICKDAINPGGIKLDRTFIEVAKFFDKDGITAEAKKHC
jgi:Galactosyltransferase